METIVFHIVASAIFGGAVSISYFFTSLGVRASRRFHITLLMAAILTASVITVIDDNFALSLGVLGILTLVRLRLSLKTFWEAAHILWALIIGICCGTGAYFTALTGTVVLYVMMLILGRVKENRPILLFIRSSRKTERQIESAVFEYFSARARLQTINATRDAVELEYDIPGRVYGFSSQKEKSISDLLYEIEGMEYVKITPQNEELMD